MVDYSTALPQQQYFQAPDLMQNAMRMQQMQTHGLQVQELARKRSEEAALRNITADPNSPEFARQAMLISPEFGLKAIAMQRQNTAADRASEASSRQAQEAVLRMANIHQTMGETAYTNAQNRLAAIPPGDAGSYAKWYATFSPAYKGMNLPTPEQWAQDTNGQLKGHMIATSESARALAKPEILDIGGVKLRYVPGTGAAQEIGMTPFASQGADTGAGAGTGPAMVPMNPNRLTAMQDTQARLGLPVMQPSAAGANAAVNNMPGVPVAPPVGAPVNNMPGVPVPDAGVKNAMRAGPLGIQSPYGAPIGAGAFAQQQQAQADQRALALDLAKKRGESQVAQQEALPKAKAENIAQREVGFEKATTGVKTATQELDEQIRLVNELRTHPGLTNITGTLYGGTPNLSQSASNAQSLLDTVKEKGKLTALLNLKEAGGTLGQVSNAEGEGLRQSIAPLGQRQDTETFQRRLSDYAAKLEAAKAKLSGAYEDTYSYKGAKAPESSFNVADPTGKVHTFLSQQAADQFRQAAGL